MPSGRAGPRIRRRSSRTALPVWSSRSPWPRTGSTCSSAASTCSPGASTRLSWRPRQARTRPPRLRRRPGPLTGGIDAAERAAAAGENLAAWSAEAPWTKEGADGRNLLSSDTGTGHDAARILLDTARAPIVKELMAISAPGTRLLVGLPDRDLLVVGTLAPDDPAFGPQFQDF